MAFRGIDQSHEEWAYESGLGGPHNAKGEDRESRSSHQTTAGTSNYYSLFVGSTNSFFSFGVNPHPSFFVALPYPGFCPLHFGVHSIPELCDCLTIPALSSASFIVQPSDDIFEQRKLCPPPFLWYCFVTWSVPSQCRLGLLATLNLGCRNGTCVPGHFDSHF